MILGMPHLDIVYDGGEDLELKVLKLSCDFSVHIPNSQLIIFRLKVPSCLLLIELDWLSTYRVLLNCFEYTI